MPTMIAAVIFSGFLADCAFCEAKVAGMARSYGVCCKVAGMACCYGMSELP